MLWRLVWDKLAELMVALCDLVTVLFTLLGLYRPYLQQRQLSPHDGRPETDSKSRQLVVLPGRLL